MSRTDTAAWSAGGPPALTQRLAPGALLPLCLRHAVLNLVTLGLYRFWGQSRVRRRLWSACELDGQPLDYRGGGAELLTGFLVMLVLVGAALATAAAAIQGLGAWGAPMALAGVAAAIFLHAFGRFAGFVYLASRTSWRGESFEVTGSPELFALGELGDAAMTLATLGWWRPQADRRRAQRLWGGLRHGGRALGYDPAAAGRTPLYAAFSIGWFASLMAGIFAAGVLAGLAEGVLPGLEPGEAPTPLEALQLAGLALLLALGLAAAWAPYQAARRSAIAAGLGHGPRLKGGAHTRLSLENAAALLLSLGILAPWTQARTSVFVLGALKTRRPRRRAPDKPPFADPEIFSDFRHLPSPAAAR